MNPSSPSSMFRRRILLAAAASGAAPLLACATRPTGADMLPVVFVPGNGDTAAIWMTTIWRFESNGWPSNRLHAIDMPYPLARDDDSRAQPGRSSAAENTAFLAAEVRMQLARAAIVDEGDIARRSGIHRRCRNAHVPPVVGREYGQRRWRWRTLDWHVARALLPQRPRHDKKQRGKQQPAVGHRAHGVPPFAAT